MIVKPVTNIEFYTNTCELIDQSYTYQCEWHEKQKQKKFTSNPTFVGAFRNITAHSLPFLLTDNNLLLSDHVWPLLWKHKHKPHKTHKLWTQWNEKLEINSPKITKKFSEKNQYVWMPIDEESSNNAWHFWIDIISRLRLLQYSVSAFKPVFEYVFVFPNMGPYMKKALGEAFPEMKFIIMPKYEYWHFEDLLVPSMSNCDDGVITPHLAPWINKRWMPKRKTAKRKIFISRDDAPARQLTNSEELFMALKGWEKVNLSNMTLLDQIDLFSEATHIMSTHGAGLINTLWAPKDTKVIEITQSELVNKKPYPILSMFLRHKHHVVLADKVPMPNIHKPKNVKRLKDYNNLKIDINKVIKFL